MSGLESTPNSSERGANDNRRLERADTYAGQVKEYLKQARISLMEGNVGRAKLLHSLGQTRLEELRYELSETVYERLQEESEKLYVSLNPDDELEDAD